MSDTTAAAPVDVEELGYYGKVHGEDIGAPYISLPLPNHYGMPRFSRGSWKGSPVSSGQYVSATLVTDRRFAVARPFWTEGERVEVFLGRGDGMYLHAPNEPSEISAAREDPEGFHRRWPVGANDPQADHLAFPREWLRPIAEAMLKLADHLESANHAESPE